MNVHDLVFAVGSGIFAISLVPAVWKRAVMPLSTSVPTAAVLTAFLVNYTTMRFWYAVAMEAITCACWWALVVIGMTRRPPPGDMERVLNLLGLEVIDPSKPITKINVRGAS